jgi:hypothetical protein
MFLTRIRAFCELISVKSLEGYGALYVEMMQEGRWSSPGLEKQLTTVSHLQVLQCDGLQCDYSVMDYRVTSV